MAEFKADLNPKSNATSLTDLLKTRAYLNELKPTAKPAPKAAPIIDKSTPWENTDLNTGKGDMDIGFKFGAGNTKD